MRNRESCNAARAFFFFSSLHAARSFWRLVFNPDDGITHMHYLSVSLSKTMALSDSSTTKASHDEAAQLASTLLNISLTSGDNGNSHDHQQQQQQDLLFNPTHRIDDDIDDTLAPRSLKVNRSLATVGSIHAKLIYISI